MSLVDPVDPRDFSHRWNSYTVPTSLLTLRGHMYIRIISELVTLTKDWLCIVKEKTQQFVVLLFSCFVWPLFTLSGATVLDAFTHLYYKHFTACHFSLHCTENFETCTEAKK